jgi:RHS repeat-associated protein
MQAQYVWSPVYVDALVERHTGNGPRLYAQQDANWNVTAVVDTTGTVQERYVYDPYGQATALDPVSWQPLGGSQFGWVYLHQGGRLDTATGLYLFRHRDYSSTLGRWMQLDPIGIWGDPINRGNGYAYVGDNPVNRTDPQGLQGLSDQDTATLRSDLNALRSLYNQLTTDWWSGFCDPSGLKAAAPAEGIQRGVAELQKRGIPNP